MILVALVSLKRSKRNTMATGSDFLLKRKERVVWLKIAASVTFYWMNSLKFCTMGLVWVWKTIKSILGLNYHIL